MRQIITLLAILLLTACASAPMTDEEAVMVPPERIIDKSVLMAQSGTGRVTVKRENNFAGSPCANRVFVDAKPIADLRVGEKVVFYLPPGDHVFGALPLSFCGGSLTELSGTVRLDKPIAFRMGVSPTTGFYFNATAF